MINNLHSISTIGAVRWESRSFDVVVMAARLEAEKFTGKNDYGLWKMKMRAILVQQGLVAVLTSADTDEKGKMPALDEKAQAKLDQMQLKAHSTVMLCLGDKVLREVHRRPRRLQS